MKFSQMISKCLIFEFPSHRLYLDNLLARGEYENAAKLCLRAFDNDKVLWEEEVYKFVNVHQLRFVFF